MEHKHISVLVQKVCLTWQLTEEQLLKTAPGRENLFKMARTTHTAAELDAARSPDKLPDIPEAECALMLRAFDAHLLEPSVWLLVNRFA